MFTVDNPMTPNKDDIKLSLLARLYNVTIYVQGENGNWFDRKQFYAEDIFNAVSQGEKYGTVVKICLSNYDDENWRFEI